MKKLIACLIAIGVGFMTGLAFVLANPECYQMEKGVMRFHPTVFFGALILFGAMIRKINSFRKIGGVIIALANSPFERY